jgi:hypothetical protein
MSQYSYVPAGSDGSTPAGLTARWNATGMTIQTDGAAKVLKITNAGGTATPIGFYSNDAIDSDADRDNVEIYGEFLTTSLSGPWFCAVRGQNASGTGYCYFCRIVNGTSIAIGRVANGTTSSSVFTSSTTVATSTWYKFRFRANGTSVKLRFWADGDPEPSTWNIDASEGNVTGVGWAGPGYRLGATSSVEWRFIGIGTNGDTAPTTASVPATAPSATGGYSTSGIGTSALGKATAASASGQIILSGIAQAAQGKASAGSALAQILFSGLGSPASGRASASSCIGEISASGIGGAALGKASAPSALAEVLFSGLAVGAKGKALAPETIGTVIYSGVGLVPFIGNGFEFNNPDFWTLPSRGYQMKISSRGYSWKVPL